MAEAHGGDIDAAIRRFGGAAGTWIDLSTGINRRPYPVPRLTGDAWTALPTAARTDAAMTAARGAYRTDAPGLPLAGAQAAIQLIPRLRPPGPARVLSPTYNEHAHVFRTAGWQVEEVGRIADLPGPGAAVVVNPNNPGGERHAPAALADLAAHVELLVVDESFADPMPHLSLLPALPLPNTIVLRSFGKFYGLAGLRLGFAFGPELQVAALAAMAGPWAVSGPALEAGAAALADHAWRATAIRRLTAEAARLDEIAGAAGWRLLGGTPLFRLYETGDGAAAQERLARHRIWSRRFESHPGWLRLGLPGIKNEWTRLEAAISGRGGDVE